MTTDALHIAACGNFDPEGGRFWTLRRGFEEHGCTVSQHNADRKGLFAKYRDLHTLLKEMPVPDAVLAPFLSHYLVPLLWLYCRRKRIPLILDAFLSLYDTEVHDRRRISRWHPKAWMLWLTDWTACRMASVVLVDTPEHAGYFTHTFGISPANILALPIGCRTDLFTPLPSASHEGYVVEFHGTFIPLQGIDVILRAARLVQETHPEILFRIIGRGQTTKDMEQLARELGLKNVTFTGAMPMEQLPKEMAAADACLGIFGTTAKASRVIPNKAYEILHCGKPLITMKSGAAARVLNDGDAAMLTKPGNPEDLARAIVRLRQDPALAVRIAEKGRSLALEKFTPRVIVEPLFLWLKRSSSRA